MIPRQFFRSIHTNYVHCYASKKTLLSKLRKKTGYTFVNCKKALDLHENDMDKVWHELNCDFYMSTVAFIYLVSLGRRMAKGTGPVSGMESGDKITIQVNFTRVDSGGHQ